MTTPPIVILAATYWEVREFIHAAKMVKRDSVTYELSNRTIPLILKLSGIGEKNARQTAEKMSVCTPQLILSTGFAGALKNGIEAGDLVLDVEKSEPKISEMVFKISEKNGVRIHKGRFYTSRQILATKEEKVNAGDKTGAIAVEMESAAIFQVCRDKKIPFCSFRCISDTMGQDLPQTFSLYAKEGDHTLIDFFSVLLKNPRDWIKLFQLSCSLKKVGKNLTEVLRDFTQMELEK